MKAKEFLHALNSILEEFEKTQLDKVDTVAEWIAGAVEVERFAVLFGSGHSYMPTADTFPRIGSFPAWLPIHELSTSYIATTAGNQGLRQSIFLEKIEGFGNIVLENYRLDPRDVMIVISNSGVNPMGIDIALNARKQGLKTVAITSLDHSRASASRHSNDKRLFEVVDMVIDTCVPQGDALVEVEGFSAKVAAASTIAGGVVMQTLAAQTAQKLAERGIILPVYPSHNTRMTEEEKERIEAMAEEVMAEYTRRTANLHK
jgi:uncharacterized phosphosugar-binding protein